jgi:predicted enzyme related to lactoylglutathione lyase
LALIHGVEHIALCAEDIPSLIAWYQKVFGLELIKEGEGGPSFLKFPDGMLVEFIQAAGERPSDPEEKEKGLRHIAITVSPIEEMVSMLKEEGVTVVEDFKVVPNGTKLFLFRDSEGNVVQLVERKIALVG